MDAKDPTAMQVKELQAELKKAGWTYSNKNKSELIDCVRLLRRASDPAQVSEQMSEIDSKDASGAGKSSENLLVLGFRLFCLFRGGSALVAPSLTCVWCCRSWRQRFRGRKIAKVWRGRRQGREQRRARVPPEARESAGRQPEDELGAHGGCSGCVAAHGITSPIADIVPFSSGENGFDLPAVPRAGKENKFAAVAARVMAAAAGAESKGAGSGSGSGSSESKESALDFDFEALVEDDEEVSDDYYDSDDGGGSSSEEEDDAGKRRADSEDEEGAADDAAAAGGAGAGGVTKKRKAHEVGLADRGGSAKKTKKSRGGKRSKQTPWVPAVENEPLLQVRLVVSLRIMDADC
jgi:hypothetical protein